MNWLKQVFVVMRLELTKTFFARRGLWVYLLALAPILLYAGHSIYAPREQDRLARLHARYPQQTGALKALPLGTTQDQVVKIFGQPSAQRGPPRTLRIPATFAVAAHLLLYFKCKARKPLAHEVQRQQQSAGTQTLGGQRMPLRDQSGWGPARCCAGGTDLVRGLRAVNRVSYRQAKWCRPRDPGS